MFMVDKEEKSFKDSMNMVFGNGVIVMLILLFQNYSQSETERNLVGVLLPIAMSLFAVHSLASNFNRRLQRLEALNDPTKSFPPPKGKPSLWWLLVVGAFGGLITSLIWHTIRWDMGYEGAARGGKDLPFLLTGLGLGAISAIFLWIKRRNKRLLE
jgi:drug/metabolite transporter (DMT)-like permease